MKQVYCMAAMRQALKQFRHVHLLEIGSWCGVSAALWAEAILRYGTKSAIENSRITCIDPWISYFSDSDIQKSEHYKKMDEAAKSGSAFDVFRHNIEEIKSVIGLKVDFFRGTSAEILPTLPDMSYNFIYIDGSHYYEDVRLDIQQSMRLISSDGFLCGDDLEAQLSDSNREVALKHASEDYVFPAQDRDGFHPGVTLAVHECLGEVSGYSGFWILERKEGVYRKVELSPSKYFVPSFMQGKKRKKFMKFVSKRVHNIEPSLHSLIDYINARTIRV